jgi:hypothetical protein
MHRPLTTVFLAFIATGLVFASPAFAGDEALREQIQELEKKIDALSGQQSTQLEQTIESYLDKSSAWKSAEGDGGMKNITITAALTVNFFGSVDETPTSTHTMSGDVDLGFNFQVTDNVTLNILAVAAAGGGSASTVESVGNWSGATDGIGTNGNVSTTGTGRALNVDEASVTVNVPNSNFSIEFGAIDPRRRVLQNEYADDENTQFINNLFDDVASVLWQTGASGAGVLGLHMWASFGGDNNDQFTVSLGWYNPAGAFFTQGSLFVQVSAHIAAGEGKGMNIRVMLNWDDVNKDSGGDATIAWGLSWDMELSDMLGVFVRIAGNDDDGARGNPVEFDASFGAQMVMGDDGNVIGLAIGLVQNNETVTGILPEHLEITVEVYYRINLQGGKLQVTPFVMFISNPGSGADPTNDTLLLLGFRVHVPF